jgi:phosphoglucosamine mutase
MGLRFGTDGVRGAAHTELTIEFVHRLGRAAATALGTGRWIVARDTRQSGAAFEAALADGLIAAGATVTRAGELPTPALAFLAAQDGVPAAMITASHNAYHDNGIKLFAAGGTKLDDTAEAGVEALLDESDVLDARSVDRETLRDGTGHGPSPDLAERYVTHLVGLFPPDCLAGMSIVLDCANGAMSVVAPLVAAALGADVRVIHAEPDGRNINADCGATAPGSLAAAVVAGEADLGLAFDGDGDRVIAVDHLGDVVDGDRMIALAALQLRDEGQLTDDTVVVTVMSNLGFHKAMDAAGIRAVATAVGDRYVLEALERDGLALGGEQSGHIIYRHLATTGDGLLAGLRLAEYVHDSGHTLAELAGRVMHRYPQVLVNVAVADRHPDVADELASEIAAAEQALGGDGRILVRPSGTEPLIRVMVEAGTAEAAGEAAERLAAVVTERFG